MKQVNGNSIELSKTRAEPAINALDDLEASDIFFPEPRSDGVKTSIVTAALDNGQSADVVAGNPGAVAHSDSLGFSNISLIINPASGPACGGANSHKPVTSTLPDQDIIGSWAYEHIVSGASVSGSSLDFQGNTDSRKDVGGLKFGSPNKSSVPKHDVISKSKSKSVSTLNLNLDLPPASERVVYGFGVKMVSTSSSQSLIFRSIPPRPLSYTLTDVLDSSRPGARKLRSKTAPVSTNTPDEYAQRFKSRPTTRPKVIEFDGSVVSSRPHKSVVSGGFPTARARIYIGHPKSRPTSEPGETQHVTPARAGSKLQLEPLNHVTHQAFATSRSSTAQGHETAVTSRTQTQRSERPPKTPNSTSFSAAQSQQQRSQAKSAASSLPGHPAKSTRSSSTRATENLKEASQSIDFSTMLTSEIPPEDDVDHIHNPDILLTSSTDCDDLSILPRPKKVLPKRELPWVFRYKVKRGMNTLSRIMASKPPQSLMHSNHAFS